MSRPIQILVGVAAVAVLLLVGYVFLDRLYLAPRREAAEARTAHDVSECRLAESDLARFEQDGRLPAGVSEAKLRLVVSSCIARRGLGELP